MTAFIKYLLNGLSTGSIYALVALGYTMVYGIIKLINFAHGDFIMAGCFVVWRVTSVLYDAGVPLIGIITVDMIVSILTISILVFLTEKLAYKPLRKSKRITALITAIGVSSLLQNVFLAIFSSNEKKVDGRSIELGYFKIGAIRTSYNLIFIIVLLIICTVALTYFVNKTKMGKAMKAVSENPDAASLMGVNVDRTISITFIIGGTLAAVAAVLYIMFFKSVGPKIGSTLGIKAFIAAVLGGIGILPGAVLGGMIIGVVENLTIAYVSSTYADVIVFAILIIVLLVKPSGILGKIKKEKV